MKLCTAEFDGSKFAAILKGDQLLPVSDVNVKRGTRYSSNLFELISDPQPTLPGRFRPPRPASLRASH
jgi:hypothetical protein